jgi:hypothetical protein
MLKKYRTESTEKFHCKNCDYVTSRLSHYERHLSTRKHKFQHFGNNWQHLATTASSTFDCSCGKSYSDRSGLWKHKKTCTKKVRHENDNLITTELVMQIINDNKEMKEMIKLQNNTIQQQTITIDKILSNPLCTIGNNSNNKFNINVFLNETCKDAMNISDFVSSIKLSLEDLEHTGKRGYVEGISNIIIKHLKDLGHHNRPIHCNNQKRETIYIKDNGEWTKETDNKPILTNAIKEISNENIKLISSWISSNPNCDKYYSNKNDLYLQIVSNSMNGISDEESRKNISKIISNVAKETLIDK